MIVQSITVPEEAYLPTLKQWRYTCTITLSADHIERERLRKIRDCPIQEQRPPMLFTILVSMMTLVQRIERLKEAVGELME